MKLSQLISADQILPEMRAQEHWSAIVELVEHLRIVGKIDVPLEAEILESLRLREELVSTGIGSGVAIPHAFSDHIDEVIAVLGRSKLGIDFEALDGGPVHFIFLFIVPSKDHHLHLRTLAAIAKMFTNSEIRRRIGEAASREEILTILDPKASRAAS
jgi:mannitol/fructose-specific phosphotransferase system IIA component (Ntr-type)